MKVSVYQNKTLLHELSILNDDIAFGGEIFIGRSDDCHIVLESHQISRHHAIVFLHDGQLKIKSNSQYGNVRINGSEIQEAIVPVNGKITIYDFELVFNEFDEILSASNTISATEGDITQIISPPSSEDQHSLEDEAGDLGGLDYEDADNLINEQTVVGSDDLLDNFEDEAGDELMAGPLEDEASLDDLENSDFNEDSTYSHEYDGGEPTSFDENNFVDDASLDEGEDLGVDDPLSDEEDIESVSDDVEDSNFDDMNDQTDDDNQNDMTFSDIDSLEDEGSFDQDFSGDDSDFGDSAGGFGDDGGFSDEDSKTQVISTFAKYKLQIFGEYSPFDSYILDDQVTKIGRDPNECQIVLDDPEVSKVHAYIKKSIVDCVLIDNDSSNGIIYNGERVNKAELTNGDEFIIGETTFTVSISSDLLDSERGRLMPVEENQEVIIEDELSQDMSFGDTDGEEDVLDFSTGIIEEEPKSLLAKIKKDPKKRNIAIVVVVILGLLLFTDSPKPEKNIAKDPKKGVPVTKDKDKKSKFSPEKLEFMEQNYQLATAKFNGGEYHEAKEYINLVQKIDPNYKASQTLAKSIQDSLDAIKRLKEEEEERKRRAEKLKKIADLVEKATQAVAEKKVESARNYFSEIYKLDPENIDIPPLKIEIDAYVAEKERIKREKELKIARRKAIEEKLKPGEMAYLKKEFFEASIQLTKFLSNNSGEQENKDLVEKAANMLNDANAKLQARIEPLLSKARSYKEGQDLKQAYESYKEVLKYAPFNEEALNEKISIREILNKRSKKIFREGLIKEDLSDFASAKEKFEEVKQISPKDSEYFDKAVKKLENYLE